MKTGLIIGTHGAVPYIHLQLESRARFCPTIPCLVLDDASEDGERLRNLCGTYGALFESSKERKGHQMGDLSVFTTGMDWACDYNLDVLVKFSRRWIPTAPWLGKMEQLIEETDAPTLSGACKFHHFGFRSEAVAMHVPSWLVTDGIRPIREAIERRWTPLPEATVHQAAKRAWEVATPRAKEAKAKDAEHHNGGGGYIRWPMLGASKRDPRADVLWHEAAGKHEYLRALYQWGITHYELSDLEPK